MAIIWNAIGCRNVSAQLDSSANKLRDLLERELEASVNKDRNAYDSAAATKIFDALKQLQSKGPDFIESVTRCSKYLSDKVAPAYEEAERKAANRVGN